MTEMADTTPLSSYGWDGMRRTCILKEGNITATTSGLSSHGGESKKTFNSYADPVSVDDLVLLNTDTANTLDNTNGMPVVEVVDGPGDLACGICVSEPRPVKIAGSNQTTWSDMLDDGYYRIAEIWFFCSKSSIKVDTPDAANGTAIVPGDGCVYDLDADGWVYASTLGIGDGERYDASGDDTGNLGQMAEATSLFYSASDSGVTELVFDMHFKQVQD